MAPEVHEQVPGGGRSTYSRNADIFSLGLVFYFVFEEVRPAIVGAMSKDEHITALRQGSRPSYLRSPTSMRRIIDLTLATNIYLRPKAEDLIYLIRGTVPISNGFPWCCMSAPPSQQNEERAEAILARLELERADAEKKLARKRAQATRGVKYYTDDIVSDEKQHEEARNESRPSTSATFDASSFSAMQLGKINKLRTVSRSFSEELVGLDI